jgi:hypothetical protein
LIRDQVGRSKNARLILTFLSSQLKSPFSKELISAIQEKAIEIGVIDSVSSDASDEGKPFPSSLDLEAKGARKETRRRRTVHELRSFRKLLLILG